MRKTDSRYWLSRRQTSYADKLLQRVANAVIQLLLSQGEFICKMLYELHQEKNLVGYNIFICIPGLVALYFKFRVKQFAMYKKKIYVVLLHQ